MNDIIPLVVLVFTIIMLAIVATINIRANQRMRKRHNEFIKGMTK